MLTLRFSMGCVLVNSRFASLAEGYLAIASPYPEVTDAKLYRFLHGFSRAGLTPTHLCRLRYGYDKVKIRKIFSVPILFPCSACAELAMLTRLMPGGFAYPAPFAPKGSFRNLGRCKYTSLHQNLTVVQEY